MSYLRVYNPHTDIGCITNYGQWKPEKIPWCDSLVYYTHRFLESDT